MTQDKDREIAIGIMRESEHEICIYTENIDSCEVYKEVVKALRSVREEAWNEAIESAADFVRAPCLYQLKPCGACRNCDLTKISIKLRSLKKSQSGKEKPHGNV